MTEIAVPKLINARTLAAESGLSIWRIYELCREQKLPHRRLGRSVWFTREAVAPFLNGTDGPPVSARNGDIGTQAPVRRRRGTG